MFISHHAEALCDPIPSKSFAWRCSQLCFCQLFVSLLAHIWYVQMPFGIHFLFWRAGPTPPPDARSDEKQYWETPSEILQRLDIKAGSSSEHLWLEEETSDLKWESQSGVYVSNQPIPAVGSRTNFPADAIAAFAANAQSILQALGDSVVAPLKPKRGVKRPGTQAAAKAVISKKTINKARSDSKISTLRSN